MYLHSIVFSFFLFPATQHGFEVSSMVTAADVRSHQCWQCDWSGECGFVDVARTQLYTIDEYGLVTGEAAMRAEIAAHGPIACSLNSEASAFNDYRGGVIRCDRALPECALPIDHVVVIVGWGQDAATGLEYWIGRNAYGTTWGEGAGGGWFRLERGVNALSMEANPCSWGTPAKADVARALKQFQLSK